MGETNGKSELFRKVCLWRPKSVRSPEIKATSGLRVLCSSAIEGRPLHKGKFVPLLGKKGEGGRSFSCVCCFSGAFSSNESSCPHGRFGVAYSEPLYS